MTKEYKYKLQGDGRDSWTCTEKEGDKIINKYMVYENPDIPKKVNLSDIDIDSLTDEQISKLKKRFGL